MLAAAFAYALNPSADTGKARARFEGGRKRRKKGAGQGGSGTTLRKFAPTKQPAGYYEQATDARHIHPRRLRAYAGPQPWTPPTTNLAAK